MGCLPGPSHRPKSKAAVHYRLSLRFPDHLEIPVVAGALGLKIDPVYMETCLNLSNGRRSILRESQLEFEGAVCVIQQVKDLEQVEA
jgi:hypothetical protein